MSIGKRIKQLRFEHNLSQAELGAIAGVTDKAVSTWEMDLKIPRMGAIEKMAAYFGVTKSYIIDGVQKAPHIESTIPPGFEPLPKMRKVPVIGEIACGEPITAEQNIEGYVDAPMDVHADFVLICKGDSMIDAVIWNGDAVFIRIQETVENGEIAAVRIDDEATLKRVYWDGDTLVLMPANNAYAPKSFRGEEINDVHIEGKAIGYMHWF